MLKEHPNVQYVLVQNKCDLLEQSSTNTHDLHISAKEANGLQDIIAYLSETAKKTDTHKAFLLNERQAILLKEYLSAIQRALSLTKEGMTTDVLAIELRTALDTIGLILGTVYTEELLNDVFANFCIGK